MIALAVSAVVLPFVSAAVFDLLAVAGKMLAAPNFDERESRHV